MLCFKLSKKPPQIAGFFDEYYACVASMWISRETSSLTTNPPDSRGAFQVSPKSGRWIVPFTSNPTTGFPSIPAPTPSDVAERVIDFVTPLRVRSPTTSNPSSFFVKDVEVNERVGNCAASKKSAEVRCPSRASL